MKLFQIECIGKSHVNFVNSLTRVLSIVSYIKCDKPALYMPHVKYDGHSLVWFKPLIK